MKSVHFSKFGFTTGVFLVVLYFICLAWGAFMTSPDIAELHGQLLTMAFPGFTWLTIGSVIWGALLSFVYGFLGAGLFSFIKNIFCYSHQKSCCN